MADSSQVLINAVLTLLRPLVRILLKHGVNHNAFSELAKKAYVDVAGDMAIPGKRQTISRIAVLTGLTRKEVKRIQESSFEEENDRLNRYNRSIRVISGWLNDRLFLDEFNRPADLPVEGAEASFATLVKKYSGDIPVQAMLSEFVHANVVEIKDDGGVKLLKHAFIPDKDVTDRLFILGTDVAELLTTIGHNIDGVNSQSLRFQRKLSNDNVLQECIPAFKKVASDKVQALLEELDKRLTEIECDENGKDAGRYVSIGIYYYESDAPNGDKDEGKS